MLAVLDEQDREMLVLRFGLDGGEPRSTAEVGALVDLAVESGCARSNDVRLLDSVTPRRRSTSSGCWPGDAEPAAGGSGPPYPSDCLRGLPPGEAEQ